MADETLDPSVEFYPAWRQALVKFLDAGFVAGDMLTQDWLYESFDIEMPTEQMPAGKAEKLRLQWLTQFRSFRAALLEQHQVMLRPETGLGYVIIPPREQTKRAYDDRLANIKRELRTMGDEMINVKEAQLTAEERRERADLLARLGTLRGMLRPPRALPPMDEE